MMSMPHTQRTPSLLSSSFQVKCSVCGRESIINSFLVIFIFLHLDGGSRMGFKSVEWVQAKHKCLCVEMSLPVKWKDPILSVFRSVGCAGVCVCVCCWIHSSVVEHLSSTFSIVGFIPGSPNNKKGRSKSNDVPLGSNAAALCSQGRRHALQESRPERLEEPGRHR